MLSVPWGGPSKACSTSGLAAAMRASAGRADAGVRSDALVLAFAELDLGSSESCGSTIISLDSGFKLKKRSSKSCLRIPADTERSPFTGRSDGVGCTDLHITRIGHDRRRVVEVVADVDNVCQTMLVLDRGLYAVYARY